MKIINQKPENNISEMSVGKKIVMCGLAVLLVVSLVVYRDTLHDIMKEIRNVTQTELIISILLAFLGYLLEGLTIFTMMGAVIPQAEIHDGIFIAFVCEFYRLTTLGNGSGIAEIHYLHEKKVEPGSATILTMIQYMMKRTAIMLLGIAGFVYLCHQERTKLLCGEYMVFMGIGCFITVIIILSFLCLALSSKAVNALLWVFEWLILRIPSRKKNFEKWKEQILLLNSSGRAILEQKKRMAGIIFLQIVKLMLFYAIPAYLIDGKIALTIGESILIMAVAFMLAGVIPTPSGAGALEFVFLLFFTCFLDTEVAVPPILLFRFATWICPAIAGGMLLLMHRVFEKKENR